MGMGDLSDLMATILAANIKTLRIRRAATQVEFAEQLGVSQGTVARWEGGAKPEFEHIVKMADMAGITVQEFTGQIMTSAKRQFANAPAGVLFLPVQLPSEDTLTEMFEALLQTIPANSDLRANAQRLARLLPGALAQTVSHMQAESGSQDRDRPREEAPEDASKSDRGPRPAPRT
jgi:transcriptional regulator with XRE-family HTH domain